MKRSEINAALKELEDKTMLDVIALGELLIDFAAHPFCRSRSNSNSFKKSGNAP